MARSLLVEEEAPLGRYHPVIARSTGEKKVPPHKLKSGVFKPVTEQVLFLVIYFQLFF